MASQLQLTDSLGKLRVKFYRGADRFHHVVEVAQEGRFLPELGSWPADDREWALDPPMQEVQPCQIGNGQPCLLGTGMASQSFWSLSLTAEDDGVLFDFACRAHADDVARLGHFYWLLPNAAGATDGEGTLRSADSLAITIEPQEVKGLVSAQIEEVPHDGTISIRPTQLSELPVRWSYAIRAR